MRSQLSPTSTGRRARLIQPLRIAPARSDGGLCHRPRPGRAARRVGFSGPRCPAEELPVSGARDIAGRTTGRAARVPDRFGHASSGRLHPIEPRDDEPHVMVRPRRVSQQRVIELTDATRCRMVGIRRMDGLHAKRNNPRTMTRVKSTISRGNPRRSRRSDWLPSPTVSAPRRIA